MMDCDPVRVKDAVVFDSVLALRRVKPDSVMSSTTSEKVNCSWPESMSRL